ncbi:MAG: tail fiber domain-containing protein, partial [Cyclobacteriaceae bacterium]
GSLSGVPVNLDTDATDDFDGDYGSLLNQPTIPTTTSQLTNDSGFVTSADDADADASNELQNLSFDGSNLNISSGTGLDVSGWDTDSSDDFDGDYESLSNKPTIPTTTSQLTNDSGFVTSADDADADASNELQNLSFDGSNLNISSGTGLDVSGWDTDSSDDFDGVFGSLSGVPANLDIDATDDFDGDYESLSNKPTIPTTTSQLTNDSGFVTSADDADADASNELQNLSFDGSNLNISSGTGLDVSGWDTDSSDDFDGDYGSLMNKPTIPTTTSQLTNDSGFVTSADDADADASNELQNLSFDGSNLNISSGTGLDVSGWDTDSSDDFDGVFGSLSGVPANLDIDATDDFNGDYESLINKPTLGDLAALDQVSSTEISDNAVSTAKVADGAITEAKLSNSVAGDGLTGGTGSALAVSLSASSGLQFNSGSLEVVVGPGTTTYEAGGAAEAIGSIVVDAHGRVVSASSKTVVLSDRRLKTDIDTLQNSMESLQKLTGYSYFLKEDSLKEDRQYGVMAQDIEEILPDLLVHRHDGYLGVDYQGLIPVLIEALKEQSLIIDELKTKVSEESAKSERYEDRISELEASVEQIVNALKSNP